MENLVQISRDYAVNPKHIIVVALNVTTLKTEVVTMAGKIPSDHDLATTIKLINGGSIIS